MTCGTYQGLLSLDLHLLVALSGSLGYVLLAKQLIQ